MKLYKRGHWTTKEKQLLKDNYNILSIEELCTRLMRTPSSITSQVNYLRKRGWTFHRRADAK
tara:strand:+ start:615 stop:800 length:186 start_codon:yes stop_codon:yes gene_type:complete